MAVDKSTADPLNMALVPKMWPLVRDPVQQATIMVISCSEKMALENVAKTDPRYVESLIMWRLSKMLRTKPIRRISLRRLGSDLCLTWSMEKTRLLTVNGRSRRPKSLLPVNDDDSKRKEIDALFSGLIRASKKKSALEDGNQGAKDWNIQV